jgi:hypothetical protein
LKQTHTHILKLITRTDTDIKQQHRRIGDKFETLKPANLNGTKTIIEFENKSITKHEQQLLENRINAAGIAKPQQSNHQNNTRMKIKRQRATHQVRG